MFRGALLLRLLKEPVLGDPFGEGRVLKSGDCGTSSYLNCALFLPGDGSEGSPFAFEFSRIFATSTSQNNIIFRFTQSD